MSITKKQHYIPQSILSYFTYDGDHTFESLLFKGNCLNQVNISNSMCENFLYEIKGLPTNLLERYFANQIDGRLATFHRESIIAIKECKFNDVRLLFERHITDILRCYYRSGAILEEYKEGYPRGEVLIRILSDTPESYISSLSRTILTDYSFAIIANSEVGFIMGDCYLTTLALGIKTRFINSSNRQIGLKNTMLILPISKNYCLVMFSGDVPKYIEENKINNLSVEECIEVNLSILYSSYRKIVGSTREMMSTILNRFSIEFFGISPTTTVVGYDSGYSIRHILKKEVFYYPRDYEIMRNLDSMLASCYNKNLGRNSKCFCGSNKKLKHCCLEKFEIVSRVSMTFSEERRCDYRISQYSTVEKVIRLS